MTSEEARVALEANVVALGRAMRGFDDAEKELRAPRFSGGISDDEPPQHLVEAVRQAKDSLRSAVRNVGYALALLKRVEQLGGETSTWRI